jgi:hypothetical protein
MSLCKAFPRGSPASSAAPAAAPRSAASAVARPSTSAARGTALMFKYHDRFLGKAVCILPDPRQIQFMTITAPLMLVTRALHLARGRAAAVAPPQQPAPPIGCMLVELWPAQRTRFMFGFTLKACDRASTVDPCAIEHFRTASRWRASILEYVMKGYASKVQVRLQWRACCAVSGSACRASACVRCVFHACCCIAGNAGWFSGALLRIAAAASSAPRRSFLCAGCCCCPRCRRTRHTEVGRKWRRRFGSLPCDG